MIIRYMNKYGSVTLETVSEFVHVSKVRSEDINPEYFLDIGRAEQIALVTENEKLQPAMVMHGDNKGKIFILHHKDSSTCAVVKASSVEFASGVNPQEEIRRLNRFNNICIIY